MKKKLKTGEANGANKPNPSVLEHIFRDRRAGRDRREIKVKSAVDDCQRSRERRRSRSGKLSSDWWLHVDYKDREFFSDK